MRALLHTGKVSAYDEIRSSRRLNETFRPAHRKLYAADIFVYVCSAAFSNSKQLNIRRRNTYFTDRNVVYNYVN